MKIKSIHVKNFKRFKDLQISALPENAKLVVLIGPNGSGKTSLFEAMHSKARSQYYGIGRGSGYYNRNQEHDSAWVVSNNQFSFHGKMPSTGEEWQKAVYVRSAYRNTPLFSNQQIALPGSALAEQRIGRMIDNDQATDKNYVRLYSGIVDAVFEKGEGGRSAEEIQQIVVGEVGKFLWKMFPGMVLNGLTAPQESVGTFCFDKGKISGFRYENLSGGEKAAFDLILDMAVKRKEFNDTVFCIDEPESHVGARAQGKLLSILHEMVPDNCQLWIATHSISMMRKAYRLQEERGDVVFLDFDRRDFDEKQEISPAKMTRVLWERMHQIVLGDLADLVMPDTVYLCESTPDVNFDANCYNKIFAEKRPTAKFVSVGSKNDLKRMRALLLTTVSKLNVVTLRDKDNATPEEVKTLRNKGERVLSRQCIESYFAEDEVLGALFRKHDWESAKLDELKEKRDAAYSESKGVKPKHVAGIVQQFCQGNFHGYPIGNTREGFFEHLAGLITPEMSVYKELEEDIFGDDSAK